MLKFIRSTCLFLITILMVTISPLSQIALSKDFISNALDSNNESVKIVLKDSDNVSPKVVVIQDNKSFKSPLAEYEFKKELVQSESDVLLTIKGLYLESNKSYEVWVNDGKTLYLALVNKDSLNSTIILSKETYVPLKISTTALGKDVNVENISLYCANDPLGTKITSISNDMLIPSGSYNIEFELSDAIADDKYLAFRKNYALTSTSNEIFVTKSEFCKIDLKFNNTTTAEFKSANFTLLADGFGGRYSAITLGYENILSMSLYASKQIYNGYCLEMFLGDSNTIEYESNRKFNLFQNYYIDTDTKYQSELIVEDNTLNSLNNLSYESFYTIDSQDNKVTFKNGAYKIILNNENEEHEFSLRYDFGNAPPDISGVYRMSMSAYYSNGYNTCFPVNLIDNYITIGESPEPTDTPKEQIELFVKNVSTGVNYVNIITRDRDYEHMFSNPSVSNNNTNNDLIISVEGNFEWSFGAVNYLWFKTSEYIFKKAITKQDIGQTIPVTKSTLTQLTFNTSDISTDYKLCDIDIRGTLNQNDNEIPFGVYDLDTINRGIFVAPGYYNLILSFKNSKDEKIEVPLKYCHIKATTSNIHIPADTVPSLVPQPTNTPTPVNTPTPTNTPTTTPAPTSATPTPTDAKTYKISGYIKPGFDVKEITPALNSGFKVETPDSNQFVLTDDKGYFEINGVPNSISTNFIKVSKPGYLSAYFSFIEINSDIILSTYSNPLTICAGDIVIEGKQDNVINMSDIIQIAMCFNKASSDLGFVSDYDFNLDGVINIADIIIVAKHFGSSSSIYMVSNVSK